VKKLSILPFLHLIGIDIIGAKTTFGNFVGEMKPIPADLEGDA
jgi:hypothetical protein